jgi:aminomethyltransferase
VRIEDTSARLAALAVQGPLSRDILRDCVDFDIDLMRWFRVRAGQIGGKPGWVSRTGYTGDLGFELWCDAADAPAVWDAVMAAGAPHGLDPVGLDALDVARIEAGYVLQGIDYVSARNTVVASQTSSPYEAGLGWTVELDRAPFVGQEPLRREAEAGSAWSLVGVELSWEGLEELYDSYGLPPHLAPVASRHSVPIYDRSARQQIGQITSSTWSPLLKRFLGIGQIRSEHANSGATVRVEHTVEHERRGVDATLVARPFFDPERKRSTPARAKKEAT